MRLCGPFVLGWLFGLVSAGRHLHVYVRVSWKVVPLPLPLLVRGLFSMNALMPLKMRAIPCKHSSLPSAELHVWSPLSLWLLHLLKLLLLLLLLPLSLLLPCQLKESPGLPTSLRP